MKENQKDLKEEYTCTYSELSIRQYVCVVALLMAGGGKFEVRNIMS